MTKTRFQNTISKEASLEGIGLHSGLKCKMHFKPAPVDYGIVIKRIDLPEEPEVKLGKGLFINKGRRTALAPEDPRVLFEVETTEHLCAAIKSLQIDNIIIEIDSSELPGLDGSAIEQVKALIEAGIEPQSGQKFVYELKREISVDTENASIVALPYEHGLKISYTLDYSGMSCSPQFYSMILSPETFINEIAPARTFCMKSEAEALLAAGFGKGANTTNTLVIDGNKPIDNEFRFENELARHKVLDLIGDLMLLGQDVNMHIIANKSGHFENNKLIEKIKETMKENEFTYSPLNYEQIKMLMPHRYPFLLVDKIIEMTATKVVGIKSVTGNEPFFQGHFPGMAVMPGVLQIEAMAQTAGLLFRVKNRDPDVMPLLLTVDKVKLRKSVVPGDQLRIVADVLTMKPEVVPTKGRVFVTCYVGDDKVSEAEVKFVLVKR